MMDEVDFLDGTEQIWQRLTQVPVRNWRRSRRKASIIGYTGVDLRKTAKRWVKTGRMSLQYVQKSVYREPGKLVVLWDVSGSMAANIPLYLPWLQRLVRLSPSVGVFPFGTRLADVTAILRKRRGDTFSVLAAMTGLWAGGTSIGLAIQSFNEQFAQQWAASGTTVLVISDGWDVGHPELIVDEFRRLRRQDARIVWMNPWMATTGFEPRTRALLAAQPFLEKMVSGHDEQALLNLML